jgi:hypothetical protein
MVGGRLYFLLSVQPKRSWHPMKKKKKKEKDKKKDKQTDNSSSASLSPPLAKKHKPSDEPKVALKIGACGGYVEVIKTKETGKADEFTAHQGKMRPVRGTMLSFFSAQRAEGEVDSIFCAARAFVNETLYSFTSAQTRTAATEPQTKTLEADPFGVVELANQLRQGGKDIAAVVLSARYRPRGNDSATDLTFARSANLVEKGTAEKKLYGDEEVEVPRCVCYLTSVPFVDPADLASRNAAFHALSKQQRQALTTTFCTQTVSKEFLWVRADVLLSRQSTQLQQPQSSTGGAQQLQDGHIEGGCISSRGRHPSRLVQNSNHICSLELPDFKRLQLDPLLTRLIRHPAVRDIIEALETTKCSAATTTTATTTSSSSSCTSHANVNIPNSNTKTDTSSHGNTNTNDTSTNNNAATPHVHVHTHSATRAPTSALPDSTHPPLIDSPNVIEVPKIEGAIPNISIFDPNTCFQLHTRAAQAGAGDLKVAYVP